MPFDRPTLAQLIDQGAAEFESRLPGVGARVRRSMVGVLNRVMAGALSTLYKYAEWLNRQTWPDQADGEYLDAHGGRWGVVRNSAAFATLTIKFVGTDGAVIPAESGLQRADGVQYVTTQEGIIDGGIAYVPATAVLAGQGGGLAANAALALLSPIAGVNSAASAQTAATGGTDPEGDEPYRARILARIRKPPQGGSAPDYEAWAKSVPGVTRVWVSPQEQGAGTVVVRFARDDDASPIPDAGEVASVQAAIDAERPVTAAVYVVAPVPAPQDFHIRLTPDSAATRAAVQENLLDLYRREAAPGSTMLISHQSEAISAAAGEADHIMMQPTINQLHTTGQFPMLGVITWL